jgi:hypothetical protein
MSGRQTQTQSPMIQQPSAESADFEVSFFPILVPSSTGGAAITKLATTAQLAALFGGGTPVGGAITDQSGNALMDHNGNSITVSSGS